MILVNRNFGSPILSQSISDMFRATSDDNLKFDYKGINHDDTVIDGLFTTILSSGSKYNLNSYQIQQPYNISIVTEKFIKVIDKIYTKVWNESFTEDGGKSVNNIATIASMLAGSGQPGFNENDNMNFVSVVGRLISAGYLLESDRLQAEDKTVLSDLTKAKLSTNIDTENKLITFSCNEPIKVTPNLNSQSGEYLNGKKLYLMIVPYQKNEQTLFKSSSEESFQNIFHIPGGYGTFQVHRPLAFFKPKSENSVYGSSLPMPTILLWRIGTPEEKEIALLEGSEVPELIFDHTDKISHIDEFSLKISYDKLQF